MEQMDQLLRGLPDQSPPPDLPQRIRHNFRQRHQKVRKVQRAASLSMLVLGTVFLLPGLTGIHLRANFPDTPRGWLQSGTDIVTNPHGSLLSFPGWLDEIQSGIWSGLPLSIWIGLTVLALGALLALICWMPRNLRRITE